MEVNEKAAKYKIDSLQAQRREKTSVDALNLTEKNLRESDDRIMKLEKDNVELGKKMCRLEEDIRMHGEAVNQINTDDKFNIFDVIKDEMEFAKPSENKPAAALQKIKELND